MINYIWMGLIVIAVCFAGWRDVTERPVTGIPDPEVLVDFEVPTEAFPTLERDSEVFFVPAALEGEEGVTGQSGVVSYDFAGEDQFSILADLPVNRSVTRQIRRDESVTVQANRLSIRVYGDGSRHRLWALFEDAEGHEYMAPGSAPIRWADEWRMIEFPFAELQPVVFRPTAQVAHPLELKEFVLLRNPDTPRTEGSFYIDDVRLLFAERTVGRSAVAAKSWMGVMTNSSAHWAAQSITLAINLIGIMMLWLGLMRVAEKAGLVQLLAKGLKPVMSRLFPDIPPDGPAMGAILMNISANMLGLGNAATPLGLKAMEELQKVNPYKKHASNAMAMLLALNTSSVTIITPAIFGFRVAAGSTDVMKFWPVMIGVTVTSTIVGVLACKFYEKLPIFRIPDDAELKDDENEEATVQ